MSLHLYSTELGDYDLDDAAHQEMIEEFREIAIEHDVVIKEIIIEDY